MKRLLMVNEHPPRRSPKTALWQQPAARLGAIVTLALVIVAGAYVLATAWLVPRIVAATVARHVAAAPLRELAYEKVSVNPFTLRVELTGVTGFEPEPRAEFRAARVVLDLDVTSLFTQSLSVAAFDLEGGELRLPDGRVVADVAASARELARNGLAGGRYNVRSGDFAGARLELAGELGDARTVGTGRIALAGLELANLAAWAPPLAPLALRGRVDLTGEYRWPAGSDPLSLAIERGRATIGRLELTAAPSLELRAESLDALATATVTLRDTTFDGSLRLELADASLALVDSHFDPQLTHEIAHAAGSVAAASTPPTVELALEGEIGGAPSRATLAATLGAAERTFALTLADAGAATLSPYARAALGRELAAGRINLDVEYADGRERSTGSLALRTRGLELGAAADGATLDLAHALLEDEHGALVLEVRLPGVLGSRAPAAAIAAAVRERVAAVVATPLATIAPLVGADAEALRGVPFDPGIAAVAATGAAALDTLAEALRRRPRLGLYVPGGFAARADRDALARQQVELHVTLATAGPTLRARPEPIDFGSARAQDVLDEFAGERLAPERIAEIAARFPGAKTAPSTAPERVDYYGALFDALVANETISAGALRRIGRYRAQAIGEALAARGIARERITVGEGAGDATTDEENLTVRVPVSFAAREPAAAAVESHVE